MSALLRFLRRRRIAPLLAITLTTAIALTAALITVLDVLRQRRLFEQRVKTEGLLLARTLNDVFADALYFSDLERLRHLSAVIKAQPEIRRFTLFAADGRIVVAPGGEKYPSGRVDGETLDAIGRGVSRVRRTPESIEVVSPIRAGPEVIGGLRIGFETAALDADIRATIRQHLWQGLLVVLLGLAVSWALGRWLVYPVRRLELAARRIAAGDLAFAAEAGRGDEIGKLGEALEEMAATLKRQERQRAEEQTRRLRESNERLRAEVAERQRAQAASERHRQRLAEAMDDLRAAQERQVQQERLRAVGQMATGVAHDINNRLQVILGLSELALRRLERDGGGPEVEASLREIAVSAAAAGKVASRLRKYYRPIPEAGNVRPFSLAEVIEQAVAVTAPRWRDQALSQGAEISVETEVASFPPLLGDPSDLQEALINLLFNAVDALPEGGTVRVHAFDDGGQVGLEVSDDGIGMTAEERRRCLMPFFTTKGAAGSGLGLAMVYGMVRRHGGSLVVESEPGAGTRVLLRLPLAPASGGARAESGDRPPRSLRVLLTDDEPEIRTTVGALLELEGHRVETAIHGHDALRKFDGGRFDVVITDRAMPEMGGDELVARLRERSPRTPIVMLSGFGDLAAPDPEQPSSVEVMLTKPVTREELRRALASLEVEPASGSAPVG